MDHAARNVGRYVLYDRIASGGMAQVHLGRLVGAVGFARTVAIKRLLPHCATDAEIVPMFVDEARLAARIRHPNVVATIDVVQENDELLLVMEYVHGESLARLLGRSRSRSVLVPPPIAIAIGISMLEGLHAAHEAKSESGEALGIVHRDVSPQNVIVGADGVARVVDFGIAKARGRIQTTRDGSVKGKAGYVAPEQLLGTPIDRRVDVYAAGVVLWESLVGRRLFEGDGAPAVMRNVLEQKVEPPSRFTAGIPKVLDDAIMRALSRESHDRFETAREMAIALERALTPASTRTVERWVHDLVSDVLEQRSALVASIESDSARAFAPSGEARTYAATSLSLVREERGAHEEERRANDDVPTQALVATPSSVELPARREDDATSPTSVTSTRTRGPWILGLVAVIGVVFAIALVRSSSTGASAAAVDTDEPIPSLFPSQVGPVEDAAPPIVEVAAASQSAAAPKHLTTPPVVKKAKPAPGHCAVPFTRGPDGTKIPKPECF